MDLQDTPAAGGVPRAGACVDRRHRDEAPPPLGGIHAADPAPYRCWQARLAEARLVGVTWPEEHGGAGLSVIEQLIVSSELHRAGCGGILDSVGIGIVGPTIIACGTEAQQRCHLGPTLDAATVSMAKWWCTEKQCQIVDRCLQLFGGYGYMLEYPVARADADARVQKIFGGTNEITKELIARSL